MGKKLNPENKVPGKNKANISSIQEPINELSEFSDDSSSSNESQKSEEMDDDTETSPENSEHENEELSLESFTKMFSQEDSEKITTTGKGRGKKNKFLTLTQALPFGDKGKQRK